MQRRAFLVTLAGGLVLALPALAAYSDDVVLQLTKQGYQDITVSTTWLGRVRIVATRGGGMREIVLNPRTGEILRDLWTGADGTQRTVSIVDDVGGASAGDGSGDGSGSGSSGGSSGGTSGGTSGSGTSGSDDGGSSGSSGGGTSGSDGGGSSGGSSGGSDGGGSSGGSGGTSGESGSGSGSDGGKDDHEPKTDN